MTEIVIKKPLSLWKVKVMGALAAGSGLVASVSAGALNTSISPILYSLPDLFTALVGLIIGALPILIILSVVAFILGIFTMILNKIKV